MMFNFGGNKIKTFNELYIEGVSNLKEDKNAILVKVLILENSNEMPLFTELKSLFKSYSN